MLCVVYLALQLFPGAAAFSLVKWNSQVRKTGLEFREFPLGIPGIPINSLKLAL